MKIEMRRALAREPFDKKLRKVEALLELSTKLKTDRAKAKRIAGAKPKRSHRECRKGESMEPSRDEAA